MSKKNEFLKRMNECNLIFQIKMFVARMHHSLGVPLFNPPISKPKHTR